MTYFQTELIKEKGIVHLTNITASQVLGILETKHSDDVFVSECKNGETWGARDLLKLDAWVLKRTYSPLTTIGYEIKVSRSDFENDRKWVGYLDLCHYFYFVCPAGLIRSCDLPSGVGLMWVSKTGNLHTKKKAERKDPDRDKLNHLLIYVIMARSKIVQNSQLFKPEEPDRLKAIREHIQKCNDRKELSYLIKGHVKEQAKILTDKEYDLKNRETTVKRFEEHLARLGITWNSDIKDWQDTNRVDQEIDMLKKVIDSWTIQKIDTAGKLLTDFVKDIKKLRGE